jgi:Zn-dependent protease
MARLAYDQVVNDRETAEENPARDSAPVARPGILMGRPFGIPVYVSPTWFIIAIVITVMFEPSAHEVVGRPASYLVAFGYAVLLYASVYAHELSHSLVARAFGLPVRAITLHLIGGISEIERDAATPGTDFLVAFAGPGLSLVLAGVAAALMETGGLPPVAHLLLTTLAAANLIVAVFNLLPGLPLDGGRMIRAGLWKLTGRRGSATVAAGWIGRVVAVLLIAACAWAAARAPAGLGSAWISLIIGALVAGFIWVGAGQSITASRFQERLPLLNARALARRAVRVTADTPLAEAVRRANEADAGAVVVVDHAGEPVGIVSESAVNATPPQRRPWVQVAALARALTPDTVLPADLAGEDLHVRLRGTPAAEYLLAEPDGTAYGVLSTADVNAALRRGALPGGTAAAPG